MLNPMGLLSGRLGWLRDEMDQLFGQYFPELASPQAPAYPPLNLWEDEDRFYGEAELPGMSLEDLDISVTGNALTITGERKAPEDKKDAVWPRRERAFGPFTRTVELPLAIDAEKVEASFKNGVLTVTLPKSEMARPRRIEIKNRKK